MKIQFSIHGDNRGSALVATLVIATLLLVASGSYLTMIGSQKKMVLRSESWNAALTMAEAGVEEALVQINASPGNLATNGWGMTGTNYGPVTRSVAGGSYSVAIFGSAQPVIYSTGFVAVAVSGEIITRKLVITTFKQGLINIALGARHAIDMQGNGVAVDSWNSRDARYSTGGVFDPAKTTTNGNVASIDGEVQVGQHTVNGSLYLGATARLNNNGGRIAGTTYNNANLEFPSVVLPNLAWQTAPLISGTHTFRTSGAFTVSDKSPIDILAGVQVTLNITTGVDYDPGTIQLHGGLTNPATASFYFNGPETATIKGNTAVDAGNRPENLRFYGLPSLKSLVFAGNSTFVGVIYAPDAAIELKGGGNAPNYIGSLIAGTINISGHYAVHYDEALATNGPSTSVVQTWQEF